MNTSFLELQKIRSNVKRQISKFLEENGYTEVDTPIFSKTAIPESTIALFQTKRYGETIKDESFYLLPSPELYMKMFIAETKASIYEFSHCFRNNEQTSSIHSSEFTMLEYYKVNADEKYSLSITENLFCHIGTLYNNKKLASPFKIISMRDYVKELTGIDLNLISSKEDMIMAVEDKGITVYDENESIADTFNRLFVSLVEPNLDDKNAPLVIYNYPSFIDCLSENSTNGKYKKRWELYFNGIELANCYKEETDKNRIKEYFKNEEQLIKNMGKTFASSKEFQEINLPPSSGVALGFDRFLMCLLNKNEIKDIIPFGYSL